MPATLSGYAFSFARSNPIDSPPEKIEAEFSEQERTLLYITRSIALPIARLQREVLSELLYDVRPPARSMLALEVNGTWASRAGMPHFPNAHDQ